MQRRDGAAEAAPFSFELMKSLLVIQHARHEGLGTFEPPLRAARVRLPIVTPIHVAQSVAIYIRCMYVNSDGRRTRIRLG